MQKTSGILILIFFIVGVASAQFDKKMPVVIAPKFKKDTLSKKKYGAVANGYTLNTKSIKAAIDALTKKGGGVVLIPSGLWLTGRHGRVRLEKLNAIGNRGGLASSNSPHG